MEYLKGPSGVFGYVIEKLSFSMPNVIVSNSHHTTSLLRKAGYRRVIETVPLGVDISRINAAVPHSVTTDIIFVGRLLSHKNAALLVQAIARVKKTIPTIQAVIIGDGPEKNAIKKLIQDESLLDTITMRDSVNSQDDVYSYMKASKMLAFPSVREGFGLVALEAMAAGIPVITTTHKDNAAKNLIMEGKNGYLIKAEVDDLASKIIQVLKNQGELNPSVNLAQYDWVNVLSKLKSLYSVR
jgi:glycosyltransferase involved in cell wall biosynthesis